MRRPQVGDRLVSICGASYFDITEGKVYEVCEVEYPDDTNIDWFWVLNDKGDDKPFTLDDFQEYWKFEEEQEILDG